MKQKTVFEINGNTYYSPKGAGDKWGMKYQAVAKACKEKRVVGAFQDSSNKWCIPDTATKPIELELIRKLLIITLSLKNTPNQEISELDNYDILPLYRYLRDTDYIKAFNEESNKIPYDVIITDKGMKLLFEGKKIKVDWLNVTSTFVQCLPSLLDIGALLLK